MGDYLDLTLLPLLRKWMQNSVSAGKTVEPGSVALVTGGSRGLGREIVLTLVADGYEVIANYLASEKEALNLAVQTSGRAVAMRADVTLSSQVQEMASLIEDRFRRLDVIVNNAGITKDNLLLRQSESEWDQVVGTNLKGCFNVIRFMTPLMIRSGGGHIVNISSYSGVKGKAGQAAYSASKSALLGLTYTSAAEFAPYGVRVNALLPGYLMTGMGPVAANAVAAAKRSSLLHDLSNPREAASFVSSILKTKNITGQVFCLDSRVL